MTLLLDTHYVYALAGSPGHLSGAERAFLSNNEHRFTISAVSLWEIRLKWNTLYASGDRKGPLDPMAVMRILIRQPIDFLTLNPMHTVTRLREPITHNDPFDELLLVQAQVEGLRLVTRDQKLTGHALAVRPF